jgi:hypothetical protein
MISILLTKHAFRFMQPMANLRAIAHLFPSAKKDDPYGVYLPAFLDGTHYILQAIEVVRRFAQHRSRYEIAGSSFIRTQ